MDIQIDSKNLLSFLKKCALDGLIKDLVIVASGGKIQARFSDKSGTNYCEVKETKVKITEEGSIRVSSLKNLIQIIGRSTSDVMRIKSNNDLFVITDGNKVGRFKAEVIQAGDGEVVESYEGLEGKPDIFDQNALVYAGKYDYKNGIEIDPEVLGMLLKDAKAFGYETYKFSYSKDTLKCIIENAHTAEKFSRVVADKGFIGEPDKIKDSTVGAGFREMVTAFSSEVDGNVKILFLDDTWLLTDEKTFYYNLHTCEEEN